MTESTAAPPDTHANSATSAAIEHILESHITSEIARGKRDVGFDMDDGPDHALISRFPILRSASEYLNSELGPAYHAADKAATRHQTRHRFLAKIAITLGVAARVHRR